MFNGYRVSSGIFLAALLCVGCVSAMAANPTRPSYYKSQSNKKNYRLESILISDTRKIAVINGVVASEGDEIEGASVISINKKSVRINRGGKVINLVLHSATIRQDH